MIAHFFQATALTIGSSCYTASPPVKYKPMAKIIPTLRRNDCPKISFHLFGILAASKSEEITDPDTVSITYDGRFSVDVPYDQICGFSAYSRKRQKRIEIIRHNRIIFVNKFPHRRLNVTRFRRTEPAGTNQRQKVLIVGFRNSFR